MKIAIIGANEALKNQIMVLLAEHAPHVETVIVNEPEDLIDNLSAAQRWCAARDLRLMVEGEVVYTSDGKFIDLDTVDIISNPDDYADYIVPRERRVELKIRSYDRDFIDKLNNLKITDDDDEKPHWQKLNTKYGSKRR